MFDDKAVLTGVRHAILVTEQLGCYKQHDALSADKILRLVH